MLTADRINPDKFFAAIRADSALFKGKLSTGQFEGSNAILVEAQRRKTAFDKLAYIYATPFHETGATMQPISERGGPGYCAKYDVGNLAKMLGNTVKGDGYLYRGRGFVQLTGRRNYTLASKKVGVDLLKNPDKAMDLVIATKILFDGMEEGWFTGKSLDSYLDGVDEADAEDLREFVNARRIINGTDKAQAIGNYALHFERAIKAAA